MKPPFDTRARALTEKEHVWPLVKKNMAVVDWVRVENGAAGAGTPDLNGVYRSVEAWVELKIRHGNLIYFRASQPPWIRRRRSVGGRVFVLVRAKDIISLYDGLDVTSPSLLSPLPKGKVKADISSVAPLAQIEVGSGWDRILSKVF